jgi:hypothetical protein
MGDPTAATPTKDIALKLFDDVIKRTASLDELDAEDAVFILWRSLSRNLAVRGRSKNELIGCIVIDAEAGFQAKV